MPAGSDRHKQDAAGNGPSFASVMRAQRSGPDQGRTQGATQNDTSSAKAPDAADDLTATGTAGSDTGTQTPGEAQHLPGLSALHRRDWRAELKTVASGEVEPEAGDPSQKTKNEIPAKGATRHHGQAANSNALPATSIQEPDSEAAERLTTLGSAEHLEESNSAKTEKPRKPQPGERAELRDTPVLASPDQVPYSEPLPVRRAEFAKSQAEQDDAPSAAASATAATATVKSPTTSAPPAFAVEMTVAAANYALASGKAAPGTERTLSSAADNATEMGKTDPSAERPRVTVLPMRAQVATTGVSAGSLTLPTAFIADDQARQSAASAGNSEEIKTRGADRTADEAPRARATPEPEAAPAGPMRALSNQGPAMQQAQASPTATVVAALAADPAARPQSVPALAQVLAPQSGSEPKTLTIQLHPAELGVVYATFQMTGGQMSVEISAETDEARSRLSAESHTIAKSLRSLGIEVDQVTVMQATTPAPSVARADETAAQNMPSARDQQSSFGAQTSGGGGGRLGGQQNGRNGHDMAGAGRDQPSAADRGDGGVYI